MKAWLAGDWGVKLGALFLASGLWLHAVTEHSYRREVEIPILVDDPASAGDAPVVVASDIPSHARVVVFGHGKDLLRLDPQELVLHLQPEIGASGRVTLRPQPTHVEDHTELSLVVETVLEPREVTVALDELAKRRVPILAMTDLRPADSFTLVGPVLLAPDSVTVSGPHTLVERIKSVATDSLELTGLTAPVQREIGIRPPVSSLLRLDHEITTLTADIQELAEYQIANVPVRVEGSSRLRAVPSRVTVTVRGGANLIGALDPETDLQLFVDVHQPADSESGHRPVQRPPGRLYEILQITPSRVDVVEP